MELKTKNRWTGRAVKRVEDAALLTGGGIFADDAGTRPGTLHAAILRSPHAHARILTLDPSAAVALPGVAAVLTAEDVHAWSDPFLVAVKAAIEDRALAATKVRYVGEPVAVVLATDRATAEDALDHVRVDYEPLPAVVDPLAADHPDAPRLHEGVANNVPHERRFHYGDVPAAFAAAPHHVEITIDYPRNCGCPMEGCVVVAEYLPAEDSYDVFSNFQGPFSVHPVMAKALRVPPSRLRLRTPANSGGSFGSKLAGFPIIVLACLAARKTGRPVKWVEDRLEHLTALASGPNRRITLSAAVTAEGEITALRFDQLEDYGAYLRAPMPGPLYRMHGVLTGAYKVRNLEVSNRIVLTNKLPASLVRGFGGPQLYFALERLVQRIAVELKLAPLDVIRRNLIPTGVFPYRTPAGALLDSGDYPAAVEQAVIDGRLAELETRRDQARAEGRLYGIGFAVVVEPAQSNMGYLSTLLSPAERERQGPKNGAVSTATVSVDPLGSVYVTADSPPQGQGHRTVLAQIVADELALSPDRITVNLEMDTQRDVWSIAAGCYSCRFSSGTAVAAQKAAAKVRERLTAIAAQLFEVTSDAVTLSEGKFLAPDGRALPFHRVAGHGHWSSLSLPDGVPPGISETTQWSPPELEAPSSADEINTSLTYGFVFDFCGIEVERDTGRIRIDRYVTMHDAGKLLNPALADGQVHGAFAQGLGAALSEELAYADDGAFLAASFSDYLLPTATEVPDPEILHFESPSPFSPLGAKGLGEGNCMSTPVCIANAVADALGIADVKLPLSPARVAGWFWEEEAPPPAGHKAAANPAASSPKGLKLASQGRVSISAPPETAWRNLLDPAILASAIPGCKTLEPVGTNSYKAVVTLGIGPVRGTFSAQVNLSDLAPPRSAHLDGSIIGPLGGGHGGGDLVLEPADGGTTVIYTYEVVLTGKVVSVGARLLEGASKVIIDQFFQSFARVIGGRPASVPWWKQLWSRVYRWGGHRR